MIRNILFLLLLTASTAFADNTNTVNGNYLCLDKNGTATACGGVLAYTCYTSTGQVVNCATIGGPSTGITGCRNCIQLRDFTARCQYPSTGYISKVIRRQVTEQLYAQQQCKRVNVTVTVNRSRNQTTFQTSGRGSVVYASPANNPFEIRVLSINNDCQLEVPITVKVRATDLAGNRFNSEYTSNIVVRGVLR